MTQDDAHIFCTREQMADELALDARTSCSTLLRDFGLDEFYLELSTQPGGQGGRVPTRSGRRPPRRCARPRSTMGLELVIDEGGGAFYGPKISVQARDAIGRTWQMSTIQLDFQPPAALRARVRRRRQRPAPADHDPPGPVRLGRAVLRHPARALRRGAADLAGARAGAGARGARRPRGVRRRGGRPAARGRRAGRRSSRPTSRSGARIRRAKLHKIPYVLVVGDDDVAAGTVGVNRRGSDRPERGVAGDRVHRGCCEVEIAEPEPADDRPGEPPP